MSTLPRCLPFLMSLLAAASPMPTLAAAAEPPSATQRDRKSVV